MCMCCSVCCVCVRNDVFIPFTQITFVWNMAHKIHLYTHSFNFFSHCLFFLFFFSPFASLLFSGWLFHPSCNFVCTITFNSFLFFSPFFFISFSRAIQISFCYLSFCLSCLPFYPYLCILFQCRFLSRHVQFLFASFFPRIQNRKMFAHFSFLAYHLRAEK